MLFSFIFIINCFGQIFYKKNVTHNSSQTQSNTLKNIYNITACGLNYTQASVTLGKKMLHYGLPYAGVDQPALLTIKGISSSAHIEQAYIWWDITGKDTTGSVIVRNPFNVIDTFTAKLIGSGLTKCWGYGASAFRADVTSIITGNGDYWISGIPTDTTFTENDANGATLFIIYSDSSTSYTGTLILNDGFVMVKNTSLTVNINDLSFAHDTSGTALMIISDLENVTYPAVSKIMMNNGPYKVITQGFWDFEQSTTAVFSSQTSSTFGVQSPWDCCNIIMTGIYYRSPTKTTVPTITFSGDTFSSSLGTHYQWYFNGKAINGANQQKYLANRAGTYSVSVEYGNGCFFFSDTFQTGCLSNFIPHIAQDGPYLWTEDTIDFSITWYKDNLPVIDSVNSYIYWAIDTGYYWIELVDSMGCNYFSDTLFTDLTIVKEGNLLSEFSIVPNPSKGKITLLSNKFFKEDLKITIYNMLGQPIHITEMNEQKSKEIDLSSYPKGIYLLKVVNKEEILTKRMVIH